MLENVLTAPTSRATVIDIFYGDYESRYRANIAKSGAASRVTTIKAPSRESLPTLPRESFDIVYIDGSHATADVLEDAVLSWQTLKPSGLMIFDDYQWIGALQAGHERDAASDFPKLAIDAFCHCFEGRYEVVHNGYQLFLRKR
jgi:predicted O-methyltransferase YrrM